MIIDEYGFSPIREGMPFHRMREHPSGERLRGEIDFWMQYIASIPLTPELPTDFACPASQSHQGAVIRFPLAPTLNRRLREFARKQRTTLCIVLMAAYDLLINRHTGPRQFTVGVPVAG